MSTTTIKSNLLTKSKISQAIDLTVVAGRETSTDSRLTIGSVSKSKISEEVIPPRILGHVEHLTKVLRDTVGFMHPNAVDPIRLNKKTYMQVVTKQGKRLLHISQLHQISIEKLMKFFYGNSLAWVMNETLELSPSPLKDSDPTLKTCLKTMFTGHFRKFLRSVFRRHTRYFLSGKTQKVKRALSFGQTLLQAKKGTPLVSEELVKEARVKHEAALGNHIASLRSRDRPYDQSALWSTMVEEEEMDDNTEKAIKSIVCEVFRKGDYEKFLRHAEVGYPSFSAHEENSRAEGGAVGVIASSVREFIPVNSAVTLPALRNQADLIMYMSSLDEKVREKLVGVLGQIPNSDHPEAFEYLQSVVYEFLRLENAVSGSPLDSKRVDMLNDFTAKCLVNNSMRAAPVFLLEPLKVRTITKGPSFPYWVLKPFQKYLWKKLKDHPTFRLIGTPISEEIMEHIGELEEGEFYVSGDYSAATDNMKAWLSKFIMSQICERIGAPQWLTTLAISALVNHVLKYVDKVDGVTTVKFVDQKNGQLMGSPMSFPILCIANAALCSLPLRGPKNMRKVRLASLPILINGDDCGMRYNERQYSYWKSLASNAGLSPSVGKCYFRKEMIQLNSELFARIKGKFVRIPYLNFSLCSNQVAKGGTERSFWDFGPAAKEFCRLAGANTAAAIDRCNSIYIRNMMPYLRKDVPRHIAFGLDRHLGGLGLPLLESKIHLTPYQRNLASLCLESLRMGKSYSFLDRSDLLPELTARAVRRFNNLCIPLYEESVSTEENLIEGISSFQPNRTMTLLEELNQRSLMEPMLWHQLRSEADFCLGVRKEVKGDDVKIKSFYIKARSLLKGFNDKVVVQATLHELLLVKKPESISLVDLSTEFSSLLKPRELYAELELLIS
jgi:hypothetical protein